MRHVTLTPAILQLMQLHYARALDSQRSPQERRQSLMQVAEFGYPLAVQSLMEDLEMGLNGAPNPALAQFWKDQANTAGIDLQPNAPGRILAREPMTPAPTEEKFSANPNRLNNPRRRSESSESSLADMKITKSR